MKPASRLLVVVLIGIFLATCKKINAPSVSKETLLEKAQAFFTSYSANQSQFVVSNPRFITPKTPIWSQAAAVNLPAGTGLSVPLSFDKDLFIRSTQGGINTFHLSNLAHLLIYPSKGSFHAEVITAFPDTTYLDHPDGPFSGILYVEQWDGTPLAKYLYEGAKILKSTESAEPAPPSNSFLQSSNVVTIQVCYQITGYNYSTASPDAGYAWSEAPVCRPSMVPVDDDPSAITYENIATTASGSGASPNSTGIEITGGTNPITSIPSYFHCFTNVGGNDHHYSVTVFVDQPSPGSRNPWVHTTGGPGGSYSAGNPVDVGHTFLAFSEQYGSTTITRNVGFYPVSMVKPGSTIQRGMLNNDQSHDYNISATFQVTNAAFTSMLNYIAEANDPGFLYNLNSENCTTFALQTLYQGGINLPRTIGTWVGGGIGNDPGDLGEDIRNMPLLPNMTKSTTPTYHFNVGVCN